MQALRRYFFTTSRLTVMFTKRYFRSRTALFFSVLFPVVLLFIFGGIFSRPTGGRFDVAIINQSDTALARQFADGIGQSKSFSVKATSGLEDAKTKLGRGEVDAVIVLPAGFGRPNPEGYPAGQAQVLYDQSGAQAGQTVAAALSGLASGINAQTTGIQPPLTVASQSTAAPGLSPFDYTFTGLIGFSLLGIGIFGPINTLPALKKTGALRRFRTTPLRPLQFIIAYMLSALAAGAVSIAIQFAIAVWLFGFQMRGNYLEFGLVVFMAAVMIFGFGMAVGGWANDEKQSAPLGNLVTFPMMFLSGVFFPRFIMPEWLQSISAFIPLSPAIDAMRMVAVESRNLIEVGPQLGLMAAWLVIIYFIAFRVFRWE